MFDACEPDPPLLVSVDVEDFYMSPESIPFSNWERYPDRIEIGMRFLLECFERCDMACTFFFLGWVAERHPALIVETAEAGHEIASHGYAHDRSREIPPAAFLTMLQREKDRLEQLARRPVVGYRAPMFSLQRGDEAHWRALAEAGFCYDSSIMPYRSYLYGESGAPRAPYRLPCGLWELPPLVVSTPWGGFPAAGGFYLRALPLAYSRWALRQARRESRPAVLYLHPWEFDPAHPRPTLPLKQRLIHNAGLSGARGRLQRLLAGRNAVTLGAYVASMEKGEP